MICTDARAALSARFDGEPFDVAADELDAHVADCTGCRAFDADLAGVRQLLRYEPVDRVPDVAPAVLAAVATARPPTKRVRLPAAAAAAVVGFVAGALYVGVDRDPSSVAAADLPHLVLDAQHEIHTLTATIDVNGDVGALSYRAPERLAVVTDGLTTVVDDGLWWAAAGTTSRVVERREPFAAAEPVPLDLIAPVDALAGAGDPEPLGTKDVDGRRAIGVRVTAGQLAALLAGLDPLHSLRPVHPTDPADLWLDEDSLVPLELTVRTADSPERNRWAAGLGLDDRAGAVLLHVTLSDVVLNRGASERMPDLPTEPPFIDGGFVTGPALRVPDPAALPDDMRPHRWGTVDGTTPVDVRTWSDGRAWLSVRATSAWAGTRLFGGLGPIVSPVDLGAAGVGYTDEDGTKVAVHTDGGLELAVTGSLSTHQLIEIAASLGVVGRPVPDGWAEATTATLDEVPDDVLQPTGLDGFGPPAVRIDGAVVTLVYGGAGDRSFRLVRSDLTRLPPPLDPDVLGVRIRGTDGRYDPGDGTLEWVEGGTVHSLRSATLSEAELLAIAEGLR